jgi:transposase-like protein
VERGGEAYAQAVGRATLNKEEILEVFARRVEPDALMMCDGAKAYQALNESGVCSVANIDSHADADAFYNINTVNGYHSFIKERNRYARGFATKYLNRYAALFSVAYRKNAFTIEDIYNMLRDENNGSFTIAATQTEGLLNI